MLRNRRETSRFTSAEWSDSALISIFFPTRIYYYLFIIPLIIDPLHVNTLFLLPPTLGELEKIDSRQEYSMFLILLLNK